MTILTTEVTETSAVQDFLESLTVQFYTTTSAALAAPHLLYNVIATGPFRAAHNSFLLLSRSYYVLGCAGIIVH